MLLEFKCDRIDQEAAGLVVVLAIQMVFNLKSWRDF